MKFKLDENFGTRNQQFFRQAGHEIQTVRDEGLEGSSDQLLHMLTQAPIEKQLWIIEVGRIRVHGSEENEN